MPDQKNFFRKFLNFLNKTYPLRIELAKHQPNKVLILDGDDAVGLPISVRPTVAAAIRLGLVLRRPRRLRLSIQCNVELIGGADAPDKVRLLVHPVPQQREDNVRLEAADGDGIEQGPVRGFVLLKRFT